MKNKKVALIVCDGMGYSKKQEGNAVVLAKTPFFDSLLVKYPHSFLRASGKFVGLKKGQMGNSETGHMNIGAGRVVAQDLTLIDNEIESGNLFKNPVLINFFNKIKAKNGDVHFVGLISNGGVHSHINHLLALLQMAKQQGVKNAYVHAITDGRDVDTHSGIKFVKELQNFCEKNNFGEIASIQGRFYAMDRDKHYDYTLQAYDAMINNVGVEIEKADSYLADCYQKGITDEFIAPAVVLKNDKPIASFNNHKDGIMFFNFRKDRTKQLTEAFILPSFDHFKRNFVVSNFVSMTEYGDFNCPVVYQKNVVKNCLCEVLSNHSFKIAKFAEPTKYAHVTYFLNGGRETPFKDEDWFLVPAKKVRTFDQAPQMSAIEIANEVVLRCTQKDYDFIMVNLANCDMVGHTGNLQATIKAVETVDKSLKIMVSFLKKHGYDILITADHGNAEQMIFRHKVCTTHTNNPVRLIYVGDNAKLLNGSLVDLSPTILSLFKIDYPAEYTGKNLIKCHSSNDA